ncbi:MAG: hypothetical protein V4819_13755 [Verrucomicrobiota bacterium]
MKRLLLAAASTLVALVLPGCLQSETTIHLKKDGSGTLVEQTTLGAQMMAMLEQMSAIGGDNAKDPVAEMFSEEKAKAKAATLGDGVTFEKVEPLDVKGNKGARTTYRFADINKLKMSTGDAMSNMSPMGDQAPEGAKQKPITFAYAGGTLTVTLPEPEKPAADAPKPIDVPEENPQMEAMMKQMLGDMTMSVKVVIEPGIAETDATYRNDNTITLVEMEMGKLLEKPDTLKKLSSAPKDNPAAAMELLKGLDGVKMETKKQVTVKLK